ncbi:MAG: (Fe-S)-binding protein [Alphaproteobacteria bacterium]|nr:(Fe-S)-binding protein [Alphaproteobacteria bacterium]
MPSYAEYLDAQAAAMLDRCTTCGRCAEVCPVLPAANLAGAALADLVEGPRAASRGEIPAALGRRWLEACNQCGVCNPACPEGINVRQWITIARAKVKTMTEPESERHARSSQQFRTMSQAIRLLLGMQARAGEIERLLAPPRDRPVDLVFYYGCNVLRTPHIIFNVMDVLDALDLDYAVAGGPTYCCGILQFQSGALDPYARMAGGTYGRFAAMGAREVLSWCPACQLQYGETFHEFAAPQFDMTHLTRFLARHVDQLRPRLTTPQPMRAVLHEHGGVDGVMEAAKVVLGAVPGLELVDVPQWRNFAYQCSRVAHYPAQQAEIHRMVAENAAAAGVQAIITVYHGCHRQLAGAEGRYDYQVLNFTDVLVAALGGGHVDHYKRYKVGGDVDAAIAAAQVFLTENGIDARSDADLLRREIFGEPGFAGRSGADAPGPPRVASS